MKTLTINSLGGIKNQLYSPEQKIASKDVVRESDEFFDINSLFWSTIFSPAHIKNLITKAIRGKNYISDIKIHAVAEQPKIFSQIVLSAIEAINTNFTFESEQSLFQSLETLEIVCSLHSLFYSNPYKLTLVQGFVLSKYSGLDLLHNCMLPFCNPYLDFLNDYVFPVILDLHPQFLILTGAPNLASFAIAKFVRENLPKCFILSYGHESDYYSLKKIESLLIKNSAFFSVYHCVSLFSESSTIEKISKALINQEDIYNVPDLIYSLDGGNTIKRSQSEKSYVRHQNLGAHDSSNVCNMKLFPNCHCYWSKCSFCGINEKYRFKQGSTWEVSNAVQRVKWFYKCGTKAFWFLDEAIPHSIVKNFYRLLQKENVQIKWHMRTRIDPAYCDTSFCLELYNAGLRHIIFGFESACGRILQEMNKFDQSFDYVEISEKIVIALTSVGIQVHFSSLIGFPTETADERAQTISFLTYLKDNYPLFSYNVNSFYLDIGSPLYREWEKHDIVSLSFPCSPHYYLENYLNWNCAINSNESVDMEEEKEAAMYYQYAWYPQGALISPSVFFAFWEFGRFSLRKDSIEKAHEIDINWLHSIALSPSLSFFHQNAETNVLYNWINHNYVVGGRVLEQLVCASKSGLDFLTFCNKYSKEQQEKVKNLLVKLSEMDFFL